MTVDDNGAAEREQPSAREGVDSVDPTLLLEAAQEARETFGRFNLAIVGGTGVGKSSLLNAIFGQDLAETGVGLPITKGIQYHADTEKGLGIWDFEGFEVGSAKSPEQIIRESLASIAERPREEQIAVVWYCVLSTSSRLTASDIAVIRAFDAAGLHVILVVTKVARVKNPVTGRWKISPDAEKLLAFLVNSSEGAGGDGDIALPVVRTVLTAAVDQGKFGGPKHGLDELLTSTLELSPEDSRDAFRIAQKLSIPMKRQLVRRVIRTAVAASAAAGGVPIPFADAVVLAPIQLQMMGRIAVVYQVDLKIIFSAQALSQIAAKFAGRALARSAIKFLPVAGNVINATVAAALTGASGEAWMRLCERIYMGEIPLDKVDEVWRAYEPTVAQIFTEFLKAKGSPQAKR